MCNASHIIISLSPLALVMLVCSTSCITSAFTFNVRKSSLIQSPQTGAAIIDNRFHPSRRRNRGNTVFPASLSLAYRKASLFANKGSEHNINSSSSSSSSINGGKTLSTKEILNHEIYLSQTATASPLLTLNEVEPVPLFSGLRLLIKSLESILETSADTASSDSGESILNHLDATTILRIEQPITGVHSIDPLCWIHAQQHMINNLRYKMRQQTKSSKNEDNTLPVIYFGDAEGHVEAAAVGKASPSYSDSWDPFIGKRIWDSVNGKSNGGSDNQDDSQVPHMFKESELPPKARVYGGSRFDWQHYQNKMYDDINSSGKKDDWDGFGGDRGGYWILPAVELRRETVELKEQDTGGAKKIVTLAVHLHNLSPTSLLAHHGQDQIQQHRQGWRNAASHTLSILRELSDKLSPPVPCTTLPPVITRSDDDDVSFECGVTEALRQINLDEVNGNAKTDKERMRKVVLARKVDLNLGASVSGLDILMRMKFGGHIGHLFYLNPGEDNGDAMPMNSDQAQIRNREFLGCTPERLFKVNGYKHDRMVSSEALAGTRIRGQTPSADNELLRELLSSKKDMLENEITGQFIREALNELEENGWLEKNKDSVAKSYDMIGDSNQAGDASAHRQRYFVRRLRHLQHICQTFEGKLSESANVIGELMFILGLWYNLCRRHAF